MYIVINATTLCAFFYTDDRRPMVSNRSTITHIFFFPTTQSEENLPRRRVNIKCTKSNLLRVLQIQLYVSVCMCVYKCIAKNKIEKGEKNGGVHPVTQWQCVPYENIVK